ncbi:phosphatidylglycerophosphatase A [bacterium]|nr:phosphatidylglycerophosphatase A [bacterium]
MGAVHALSRLAATFFGAGYAPVAPGTAGSIAAIPLYYLLKRLSWPQYVLSVIMITLVGVFASSRMEASWGKDPSRVVIDEVAGILVALVSRPAGARDILIALLLFRFFDIVKPPPVKNLEALPGGVGIMADDIAAGILSALSLRAIMKMLR